MSLLEKIMSEVGSTDEVAELVALLRSSQLPTVVVEDPSDVRIYSRWVERRLFGTYKVDVLAAGRKANLLSLYERRSEFANLPIVFVANRGMWVSSGIPEEYEGIVCTQGYSIENDVYLMSEIEKFLNFTRERKYWLVQKSIIRWFAFEVKKFGPQKYNFGLEEFIAGLSLSDLVPKGNTELDQSFCKRRGFRCLGNKITEEISEEYQLNIPGKLLFEVLDRFSETPLQALYNIALANYESKSPDLIEKIRRKLDEQSPTSLQKISPAPKIQNPVPSMQQVEDSDRILLSERTTIETDFLVDKFIVDLKGTILPTIVVAGRDNENIINRLIEPHEVKEFLHAKKVRVESIRGRDRLLSVYNRKDEFAHIFPVVFIADQEMWSFTGIPEHYADIIWTQGYNLENDLYAKAGLEFLLEPHEVWRHQQVLNSVIEWFAFEVEEFLMERGDGNIDFGLSQIVRQGEFKLDKRFCQHRGFRQPSAQFIQQIKKEHPFLLPGNFLFQILARFLSIRGRDFNFNVTGRGLYDIALTMDRPLLSDLMKETINKLSNEEERIAERKSTVSRWRKIDSQRGHSVQPKPSTKQKSRSKLKQNQAGKSQNTQSPQPPRLLRGPNFKVGDRISATVLKKDGIKVTAQLHTEGMKTETMTILKKDDIRSIVQWQTDEMEKVVFDYPYCPKRVGDEVKLRVIDIDSTGKVSKVVPLLGKLKVKVGDKVNATVLKKDSIKVTVQLQTDYKEVIDFEYPYYPGKADGEVKLKVIDIDSTGRISKVIP